MRRSTREQEEGGTHAAEPEEEGGEIAEVGGLHALDVGPRPAAEALGAPQNQLLRAGPPPPPRPCPHPCPRLCPRFHSLAHKFYTMRYSNTGACHNATLQAGLGRQQKHIDLRRLLPHAQMQVQNGSRRFPWRGSEGWNPLVELKFGIVAECIIRCIGFTHNFCDHEAFESLA